MVVRGKQRLLVTARWMLACASMTGAFLRMVRLKTKVGAGAQPLPTGGPFFYASVNETDTGR